MMIWAAVHMPKYNWIQYMIRPRYKEKLARYDETTEAEIQINGNKDNKWIKNK
jgi:hypothetical protein